jgi:hypothetical protein
MREIKEPMLMTPTELARELQFRALNQDKTSFHTRAEFAARLRCSLRKLDRLSHTNPSFPRKIKHGRATLYQTDAVDRYLVGLLGLN